MTDKTVAPLYEREPGSSPGPFYVVKDECITCSLPMKTAPHTVAYHKRPCTRNSSTLTNHCLVIRQPDTPEELDRMVDVISTSCVGAYRYCGTDPDVLQRLIKAGCAKKCDALVVKSGI